jgi:hypothetical protein
MCSDPQTRKFGAQTVTFACRRCNACVAVRRAEYIGRGMMERATSPFTLVFALTYSDENIENRRAASFFNYSHVRAFVHRLNAAVRAAGASRGVRFMVAGEQGDRTNRCHWHIVLFSEIDLLTIGTFQRMWNGKKIFVTDRAKILSRIGGNERGKVRLNWSLWPHGFASVQEADQGGLSYALSYALKDQFTVQKSADTMRHDRAENFATGLFRMSKRPAIGYLWLDQKFDRLDAQNAVLPNLNITVPDMAGYYHPSGSTREFILRRLAAITWRVRAEYGSNPPQFATLMASLTKPDERIQFYDKETHERAGQKLASDVSYFAQQAAIAAEKYRFVTRCGADLPCSECFRAQPDLAARFGFEAYSRQGPDGVEVAFINAQRKHSTQCARPTGSINPACALNGSRLLEACLSPSRE